MSVSHSNKVYNSDDDNNSEPSAAIQMEVHNLEENVDEFLEKISNSNLFKKDLQDLSSDDFTEDNLQELRRRLNRQSSYRYYLYKKSKEYYQWKNLWFSTVPLVTLSLVNFGLAVTNIASAAEIILLNSFIIAFSGIQTVYKMVSHWIDWPKTAERFETLALQMDMIAVDCSLAITKNKIQNEDKNSNNLDPEALALEKRDMIIFLEKAARIDEQLGSGMQEVPKHIKKEVDAKIEEIKEKMKNLNGKGLLIRNGDGTIEVKSETDVIEELKDTVKNSQSFEHELLKFA